MAEALIRLKDGGTAEKPEIEMEVKFSPAIMNNSPAHQMVADIIKLANMQPDQPKVIPEAKT
jgi:hypothetical protein